VRIKGLCFRFSLHQEYPKVRLIRNRRFRIRAISDQSFESLRALRKVEGLLAASKNP
jgi:hypothetical protein